jgi:hypothetical protein
MQQRSVGKSNPQFRYPPPSRRTSTAYLYPRSLKMVLEKSAESYLASLAVKKCWNFRLKSTNVPLKCQTLSHAAATSNAPCFANSPYLRISPPLFTQSPQTSIHEPLVDSKGDCLPTHFRAKCILPTDEEAKNSQGFSPSITALAEHLLSSGLGNHAVCRVGRANCGSGGPSVARE